MPPKRYFEQDLAPASATPDGEAATQTATESSSKARIPKPNATLFVSRLPFTATSTDLQTLFSDIGPLRRAFVVTDPESKASKGVGYVTFAVPEDAERAITELQGKKLDGKRAITITWADAKPSKGDDASPPTKRPRVAQAAAARTPSAATHDAAAGKDPNAVRTVILSGLSACKPAADVKTIYKRARKIGDVDEVLYPFGPSKDADVAHVVFRTPNHASTAVTKLHAHTFKAALLSAVLKKRADGVARLEARMKPETKEKMERIRKEVEQNSKSEAGIPVPLPAIDSIPVAGINTKSRLIIRNLPWDVTASDLRAVFLLFGPIYKIDVPQQVAKDKKRNDQTGKTKGKTANAAKADEAESEDEVEGSGSNEEEDAKPQLEEGASTAEQTKSSAQEEKATESATGVSRGRGFAFVWHVSRADAARALNGVNGRAIRHGEAEKAAAKSAKGPKGRQIAREALKAVRDGAQPERIVAVDWALSKEDWKRKEEEAEAAGTDAEQDSREEEASDASGDESDDNSNSDDDDEETEQKPALPTPSEGTTLFVRNLPYEATEPELLSLFRQFGPVRYARITMDRRTDPPRSKGTGFVCFWERENATAALQRAREVEAEAGTQSQGSTAPVKASQNPFSMTSVLTADPSAPLTSSFNIRGRILNVIPAVERDQADSLTVAGLKARQKQDKRNTYLMREGVPLPSTSLAQQLASNTNEIERRLASFSQRKAQLAVNPSLYISKTRLSVRQLPLFCTDRTLKRLAIHAIKAFKAEVGEDKREDLDPDETADKSFSAASKPPKKGERSTPVIQSKVVRAIDRPDPITGAGRSKGFGFLEMRSFPEALRVIRWANANKDVQKLLLEWHIEELDDLRKKLEGDLKSVDKADSAAVSKKKAAPGAAAAPVEDVPARLKRVVSRIDELKEGGSRSVDKAERGGLLFVEFSIENATIVKQRRDRAEQNRKNAERRKERAERGEDAESSEEEDEEHSEGEEDEEDGAFGGRRRGSGKPPRRANWNQSTKTKGSKADETRLRKVKGRAADKVARDGDKLGSKLGSLIGRKRRSKKGSN